MRGSSRSTTAANPWRLLRFARKDYSKFKNMKTRIIFTLTALVLFASELVIAQPGLPSAPSQAPIDGGLSLLAAAGGAYAIKKLRDKNKH